MFCMRDTKEVDKCCEDIKCAFFTPCFENHNKVLELVDDEPTEIKEVNSEGFQTVFEESEFADRYDDEIEEEQPKVTTKKAKQKEKQDVNLDDIDLLL